jgi:hypothetical protein
VAGCGSLPMVPQQDAQAHTTFVPGSLRRWQDLATRLRARLPVWLCCYGLASAGLAACGKERTQSAADQAALPGDAYGGLVQQICRAGDRDPAARRTSVEAGRELDALRRALRRYPDARVKVSVLLEDRAEPERREMTVRQLAETLLEAAQTGVPGRDACVRRWRTTLQRALDAAS